MNDDDNTPNGEAQADEDLDNTPPQEKTPAANAKGGWQMPEPVFRKTSGYLPQGFEKQFGTAAQASPEAESEDEPNEVAAQEAETAEVPVQESAKAPAADVPASPVIDVEPQPDLLEIFVEEEEDPDPAPPVKKNGVVGRVLVILLTLIIFFTLAAIFVAVVWYLLSPTPEATIN